MNIIFDYDGTLHNCLLIYAPAFRAISAKLADEGLIPRRSYTDEEVGSWLGLPSAEMWATFAPTLAMEKRREASEFVYRGMINAIEAGQAQLYPGAADVLAELKAAGHRLFYLSNCQHKYMAAHAAAFNLDTYFDAMYCAEDFAWRSKADIYPDIAAAHPGDYIMIGDRRHDMDVATAHGIPAIGCAYGYGTADELVPATHIAHSVTEIPALVAKICG